MLFAFIYLRELYLEQNVLMLSVKLMISPMMCAWSFALCLSKIKERVFSFSLGVDTWQLAKVLVMKENLSLCAVSNYTQI